LEVIPETPGVFCKYIPIDGSNFLKSIELNPLKVLLTVSWNGTESSEPYNASTSWSQNITLHGFKACVLVSGSHANSDFKSLPTAHWMVFNFRENYFRNTNVKSGISKLDTWYRGSQCKTIATLYDYDLENYRVLATVNHDQKNYQHVMTVWTEHSTTFLDQTNIRLCVREFNNLDGEHDGVFIVSLYFTLSTHNGDFKINCLMSKF